MMGAGDPVVGFATNNNNSSNGEQQHQQHHDHSNHQHATTNNSTHHHQTTTVQVIQQRNTNKIIVDDNKGRDEEARRGLLSSSSSRTRQKGGVPMDESRGSIVQQLRHYVSTNKHQAYLASILTIVFLVVRLSSSRVGGVSSSTEDYLHKGTRGYDTYISQHSSDPIFTNGVGDATILQTNYNRGVQIKLSRSLENLSDWGEPLKVGKDVPYFWHIPRSGGSTMKDLFGICLKMVQASDVGARDGHDKDKELEIIQKPAGGRFVNVDTTSLTGIHRAKTLGLVESNLSDVIITQYLHAGATLFNLRQRGRMFTLMRHPIDRAVSLFHYLAVADWEPYYDPDLAYISLDMYARSHRVEHNWMVRYLSNEIRAELTEKHLEIAKEVLRRKCLVGLLEEKEESYKRFEKYFGWSLDTDDTSTPGGGGGGGGKERGGGNGQQQQVGMTAKERSEKKVECEEKLLHWGWSNKHNHPTIDVGSEAWTLLAQKNRLDMQLYEFAKQLYAEQGKRFTDTRFVPDYEEEEEEEAKKESIASPLSLQAAAMQSP